MSRPGIIAITLDSRTDAEITLFANLLTMTPGDLSIDVSTDRISLRTVRRATSNEPD